MSDEQLRRDELVSVYLDGEATPDEASEVTGDEALMARFEDFRAVRDGVAAPVSPLSAQQRDHMIDAALEAMHAEAADPEAAPARTETLGEAPSATESEHGEGAKILPLRRARRPLLALAAGVLVLAAVLSAGLIAGRGGDEYADVASSAVIAADAPASEATTEADVDSAAPAPAEELMIQEAPMDEDMAPEAPMDMDEDMAPEAPMADEAADDMAASEAQAAAGASEAESAALDTAEAMADAEEPLLADDNDAEDFDALGEAEAVVDLGTVEHLESLLEDFAARWSAALEDTTDAEAGPCAASVAEAVLDLEPARSRSFVAAIASPNASTNTVAIDAQFVGLADGTALVVYASAPECRVEIHELPGA